MHKAYTCPFSCIVTRAIHLELVNELSTSTFINCLRRFCARRDIPTLIVSDNAKTFKHADKVLHKLMNQPENYNASVVDGTRSIF